MKIQITEKISRTIITSCQLTSSSFLVDVLSIHSVTASNNCHPHIFLYAFLELFQKCCPLPQQFVFRYRYCRMLEEGSFRGRTGDFVFMFLFGGLLMTVSFSLRFGRVNSVYFTNDNVVISFLLFILTVYDFQNITK